MSTINTLPDAPQPGDTPTQFNTKAFALVAALNDFVSETNVVAAEMVANAGTATTAATTADTKAALATAAAAEAASSAGVTQWVSGTTYAQGVVTWSPISFLTYRRTTAGAGTLDPSLDSTNWRITQSQASILRVERTAATTLIGSDRGKWIDITSGTFTQDFAAASVLGEGWWCWLSNNGAGDITLDPSGSETIDGLTSFIMYPGEARFVQCDGAALRTMVTRSFYKTMTASGNFIKPPGYSHYSGLLWAGGGGGNSYSNDVAYGYPGGGGGACSPFDINSSLLPSTVAVVIGAGGAGGAGGGYGSVGGQSSFGSYASAFGGYGGSDNNARSLGGGIFSSPTAGPGTPGLPNDGGSFGGSVCSAPSVYGGSGGASGSSASCTAGGSAAFGGAGGGCISGDGLVLGAPGTSRHGGNGGAASLTGSGSPGVAPGGGGGASKTLAAGAGAGAGARGELRIWGVI